MSFLYKKVYKRLSHLVTWPHGYSCTITFLLFLSHTHTQCLGPKSPQSTDPKSQILLPHTQKIPNLFFLCLFWRSLLHSQLFPNKTCSKKRCFYVTKEATVGKSRLKRHYLRAKNSNILSTKTMDVFPIFVRNLPFDISCVGAAPYKVA